MSSKSLAVLSILIAISFLPGFAGESSIPDLPIPQCFGVAVHFGDEQLVTQIAWLKAVGLGWVRRDIYWDQVEHAKGIYEFAPYDRLISALHAAGIRVVMILDYGNSNYDGGRAPASPEARAAFARFSATTARRYAGKVDVWEIFNEPNIDAFWKPAPDVAAYTALADEATAAIRQAVPGALIVGPALNGPFSHDISIINLSPTYRFLAHVFASKAAHEWSGITIHPYRLPRETPESTAQQYKDVRQLMRAHGIDPARVPVIAGELGYSSFADGVDEETQAAYVVRQYLLAAIEHMPFSIWYDWQDDGSDNSNRENRFGLLRSGTLGVVNAGDKLVKPSFTAVKQLSQILAGYRFEALAKGNGSVMVSRYIRNGQRAWAAWAIDNYPHSINIALPPGRWRVSRILGEAKEVNVIPGRDATIEVDKTPIIISPYLQSEPGKPEGPAIRA